MKTFLFLTILCAFAKMYAGTSDQALTNDVPILQSGMRLGLCEGTFSGSSVESILAKKELDAESDLTWILRDSLTNHSGNVVFLGMSNSFAFELKTTNGTLIPKTIKGQAMSAGPQSLTNLREAKAKRIAMGFRDFPRMTELFEFPSNGVYVVELRYWNWNGFENRFQLSDPVRLRVVKRDATSVRH
jgi:hypothetical protein